MLNHLNSHNASRLRKRMVDDQLIARGICDPRVLDAMLTIPRHLFVDHALMSRAYQDSALPIGAGQTISQPYMVARMTELLELHEGSRVLEIGTGCGYQTALLARLCRRVYSIERIESLVITAGRNLRAARHANVMLKSGDGMLGWEEYAPFDAVLAAAGGGHVPDTWMQQLKVGGLLVMPVGEGGRHMLIRRKKLSDGFSEEALEACNFVPLLPGKAG